MKEDEFRSNCLDGLSQSTSAVKIYDTLVTADYPIHNEKGLMKVVCLLKRHIVIIKYMSSN